MMETSIKMDDLGVPIIFGNTQLEKTMATYTWICLIQVLWEK